MEVRITIVRKVFVRMGIPPSLEIISFIAYLFRLALPVGLEFAPMLALPRLLAALSVFGLLTPPKAPLPDDGSVRFPCPAVG
jgi:hypothetical protein